MHFANLVYISERRGPYGETVGLFAKVGKKLFDQGNMDKSKDQKALEEEFLRAPNELVARDKLLVKFTIMRVLSELELGAVSESEWESADEDVETVYKAFLEQEGQARARGIGRIADRPSALKAASTALTVAIEVAKERLGKGECIDASMLLRGLTEAQLDEFVRICRELEKF
jgi:hypothetical protein